MKEIFLKGFEWLAMLTGVASVILAYRKNILTYFFGLISVALYVWICFESGIYADMGINVFYFVMSMYGWMNWKKLFRNNGVFIAISLNWAQQVFFFLVTMLFWFLIYFILKNYTESTVPWLDSFTAAFFISGMILMTFKSLENWIYLFIGNLASIPLFIYKDLYVSAFLYFVLSLFACLGFLSWKKTIKEH